MRSSHAGRCFCDCRDCETCPGISLPPRRGSSRPQLRPGPMPHTCCRAGRRVQPLRSTALPLLPRLRRPSSPTPFPSPGSSLHRPDQRSTSRRTLLRRDTSALSTGLPAAAHTRPTHPGRSAGGRSGAAASQTCPPCPKLPTSPPPHPRSSSTLPPTTTTNNATLAERTGETDPSPNYKRQGKAHSETWAPPRRDQAFAGRRPWFRRSGDVRGERRVRRCSFWRVSRSAAGCLEL